MTTKILFLCPHNAAKSVTAAAYVDRLAAEHGLAVSIATAGTSPDRQVLALVRDQLAADGLWIDEPPRMVTRDDFTSADYIINIGCSIDGLGSPDDRIVEWGIPNFSEDPSAAFAALAEHAQELVDHLAAGAADPDTPSR